MPSCDRRSQRRHPGALKQILLGIDMVWLEAECSRYEFFADVVMQTQPDIALVAIDSDQAQGWRHLPCDARAPHVQCARGQRLGGRQPDSPGHAQRRERVPQLSIAIEEFLAALHRIQQIHGMREGETEVRYSQIYTIAGAAGGVGCTSLAVNLACILAQDAPIASPLSTSICRSETPTSGSTLFPITPSRMSPKTSPGSITPSSSDR